MNDNRFADYRFRTNRVPTIEQPQCTSFRNGNDLRCLRREGHYGPHESHCYDDHDRRISTTWPSTPAPGRTA